MVKVHRSTIINAPIVDVWEILRDFNGHEQWHPAVRKSVIDDGRKTDQVGSIRNFVLESGEHLREQLLSLSDKDFHLRYAIVESDLPLQEYVAEITLKPVTDGERTFCSWRSEFKTPVDAENELTGLIAKEVYEAGFEAIRTRVEKKSLSSARYNPRAAIDGTAMFIDRYGGPDVLHAVAISAPPPDTDQVRLRQTAVGVNFIDIYCRTGYLDLVEPPGALGMEATGVVVDVGSNVQHLTPGQRIAYACPPVGAYTSVRTMDATLVVPLPDQIDDITAAASLLKGMSAEFLLHRVHQIKHGETVLVYAPAGGVGRILCQWANHLGATVIGVTSSEKKAHAARLAGAHHVIIPGENSIEEQVSALTDGRGVDVVYDAVGKDSFAHSVAALAPCGHLISFGQASGDMGTWNISSLASKSATISRPNFVHYTDTAEKVAAITGRLFEAIVGGIITIEVGQQHPLKEAAAAHRALEAGKTMASTVLIPGD